MNPCFIDSSGGLEYTDSPGWYDRVFTGMSPNARDSPFKVRWPPQRTPLYRPIQVLQPLASCHLARNTLQVPENEIAKFWVDSGKQLAAGRGQAQAQGRGAFRFARLDAVHRCRSRRTNPSLPPAPLPPSPLPPSLLAAAASAARGA